MASAHSDSADAAKRVPISTPSAPRTKAAASPRPSHACDARANCAARAHADEVDPPSVHAICSICSRQQLVPAIYIRGSFWAGFAVA
jgi:hypothetical protein